MATQPRRCQLPEVCFLLLEALLAAPCLSHAGWLCSCRRRASVARPVSCHRWYHPGPWTGHSPSLVNARLHQQHMLSSLPVPELTHAALPAAAKPAKPTVARAASTKGAPGGKGAGGKARDPAAEQRARQLSQEAEVGMLIPHSSCQPAHTSVPIAGGMQWIGIVCVASLNSGLGKICSAEAGSGFPWPAGRLPDAPLTGQPTVARQGRC